MVVVFLVSIDELVMPTVVTPPTINSPTRTFSVTNKSAKSITVFCLNIKSFANGTAGAEGLFLCDVADARST